MLNKSVIVAALAAAFAAPMASAAENKELAEIREQIRQMKESYESRMLALEQRLAQAQAATAAAQDEARAATSAAQVASAAAAPVASASSAPAAAPVAAPVASAASNIFNPDIAVILGGTLQNLKQDPEQYRLQGFVPPGGEVGPGSRGFSLGESEITMRANIDPKFFGQLTFALTPENEAEVEEAFIQTRDLGKGLNVKAGRFLSSIGYLNSQHSHTWDFVDAPLAYQAFLGGQYKQDGVQAKWLAPLDQFLEFGVEAGNGANFPGTARNKNGGNSLAAYAHLGDDIGDSSSYRVGASFLRSRSQERGFDDGDIANAFTGKTSTFIADAIWKWAPNGNATVTNFKLQGEYFRSKDTGTLDYDLAGADTGPLGGAYTGKQSGWYAQGVYQFMPNWRAGLRHERLRSGARNIGLVEDGTLTAASFPILEGYAPRKTSLMVDYSPSEFSRLRLQFAQDKSRPGVTDNQVFLQYIMSLGTHSAHAF
ncbi:hypothetical protein [Pseudoduganella namucuonensis]|uniref:TonB-dependent receptor n=1 Tax=Pseudoduganella namucuonensis TaxID=1035707 RepID=A0A1I7H9X8_9BURK|nr:hypothetical protein [Pseudoduganella namucuonensis]SFU57518.1 hypothetical protein SAMN05216552_100599 [Pseudoduganella namucuonensis]